MKKIRYIVPRVKVVKMESTLLQQDSNFRQYDGGAEQDVDPYGEGEENVVFE